MKVSQKIGNRSTSRASYTTPGHISQVDEIILGTFKEERYHSEKYNYLRDVQMKMEPKRQPYELVKIAKEYF